MQKIPCHCQTEATGTRFERPVLSNVSPWSINFHEAVSVLYPLHTLLRHLFVRWCSWLNKVVFLLCWRPLLSTLMWQWQQWPVSCKATGRFNNWWWFIGMQKVNRNDFCSTVWSDPSMKLKDHNFYCFEPRTALSKSRLHRQTSKKFSNLGRLSSQLANKRHCKTGQNGFTSTTTIR